MKSYKVGPILIFLASVGIALVSAKGAAPAADPVAAARSARTASASLIDPGIDVRATITALERDWAAAIAKNDAAALDRLLAEDFTGTSPTAHTFTKTIAIQELKDRKYAVKSMVLDEISVNVYGDVAVAFTSQQESSQYAGTDTSGHYHFTDVWVNRSGWWQVVASHGSRFNDGH